MKIVIVSAVLFVVCAVAGAQAQDKKAIMAKGLVVYKAYCKTCHQLNGAGLTATYPPLAGSDYLKKNPLQTIIHEVVFGKKGPVVVNGKKYNGIMAQLPKKYTNDDVASVLTYVYNSWGNPGTVVKASDVAAARADQEKKAKLAKTPPKKVIPVKKR